MRFVDVIVPVYRGLRQTRDCIESVLASACATPFELVVVNDATPELELAQWLRALAATGRITLLENARNLGFVASVNRGMLLHRDRDVVLLNSDTEVALDWLDRLAACAMHGPQVATVTPFSNNATLCSFPYPFADNALPVGWSTARLHRAFSSINAGRSVEIPTGVGFCMLITRASLNDIGLLDEEAYGEGYGEENDFCRRAVQRGWRNLLAADTFVFHEGQASFGDSASLRQQRASSTISRRFPDYHEVIEGFKQTDPPSPLREAVMEFVLRESLAESCRNVGAVLHVLGIGGGAARYVRELCEAGGAATRAHFLLFLDKGHSAVVEDARTGWRYPLCLEREGGHESDVVIEFVRAANVSVIHLHALTDESLALLPRLQRHGVLLVITLHDIGFLWREAFSDWAKPTPDERDIAWRKKLEPVLAAASVVAPSPYIARRFADAYPQLAVPVVVEPFQRKPTVPKPLENDVTRQIQHLVAQSGVRGARFRVAVVGAFGQHKGLGYLKDVRQSALAIDPSALAWVLVGYAEDALYPGIYDDLTVHGVFDPTRLAGILDAYRIDVVYFPLAMPESHCFALSDVWLAGRPAIVHDCGALGERVKSHPDGGWVLPSTLSPRQTCEAILDVLLDDTRLRSATERTKACAHEWLRDADGAVRKLEEIWMNTERKDEHLAEETITAFQRRVRLVVDDGFFRAELRKTSSDNAFLIQQNVAFRKSVEELQDLASARGDWIDKLDGDIAELRGAVDRLTEEKAAIEERLARYRRFEPIVRLADVIRGLRNRLARR